jgi:hypothetical protein
MISSAWRFCKFRGAKRCLADEYVAAQESGEVQKHGCQGKRDVPVKNIPSAADVGPSRKEIHEARAEALNRDIQLLSFWL